MKLKFIFLGKRTPNSLSVLMNDYIKRLNSYIKSEYLFLNEQNESKLEKKILNQITPNSWFVILDNNGLLLDTLKYATFIREKSINRSSLIFLVGSSYGIPSNIISLGDAKISMSHMTFPHLIARLMLVEQTYRAFTILNNHPYHHE